MVSTVFLLTSHPLVPPWDSADKHIAAGVARHLTDFTFLSIGRVGRTLGFANVREFPILSRSGRPGAAERIQAAVLGLALEGRAELVHAVLTIGPGFRVAAKLRERMPLRKRPLVHTVPGIIDPAHLDGVRPLGTTVALTAHGAQQLKAAGFDDVRVVPPGVDTDRWRARRRGTGPGVVLFAGHYGEGGGAAETIAGVAAARRSGSPVRLVLAMRTRMGQDHEREAALLHAHARRAGLEDTTVLGHVEDMSALLAEASVVVFPARSMAGKADVPILLLEAMATGRPVIVSDLPEMKPLSVAAVPVPAGDTTALATAVTDLLSSERRWDETAAAGRRLVEESFSERAAAAVYREIYTALIRAS